MRIVLIIGVAVVLVGVIVAVGSLFFISAELRQEVRQWQTLATGFFAIIAASFAFFGVILAATIQQETADRHREEDEDRARNAYTLALAADLEGHLIRAGSAREALANSQARSIVPAPNQFEVLRLRLPETFTADWQRMIHLPFDLLTGLRLHCDAIRQYEISIAVARQDPQATDVEALFRIAGNLARDAEILRNAVKEYGKGIWPSDEWGLEK